MAHSVHGSNFSYHPENGDPPSNEKKRGLDVAFSAFEQMTHGSTPNKKRYIEGVEDKAQSTAVCVQNFSHRLLFVHWHFRSS